MVPAGDDRRFARDKIAEAIPMQPAVPDLRHALSVWRSRSGSKEDAVHAALGLLDTAERCMASGADDASLHEYLDVTRGSSFLERLPDRVARERWARTTFQAIRRSGYTLRTLLSQRVAAHPDRILFEDTREAETPAWTYAQVARYTRALAALFLSTAPAPRVAILSENCVDSACADLACLTNGLLVSPLNVHSDADTLAWIFERLAIDTVVTDSDERVERLAAVRTRTATPFRVFRTGDGASASGVGDLEVGALREACTQVDLSHVDGLLEGRAIDLAAVATAMFTSGSTGHPKGVLFNHYGLVTKRFARAAALPSVGEDEVLLCYLPLFHTFGRYLEMLGSIFWGGTYVFAGNPSAEALIADLGRVRPTGLISIPARWSQIREACLESMGHDSEAALGDSAFRQVVGDRLRWGLSAAGYLDPSVFRFFQRRGVDLCSGFGMTEATGGITMTPPGAYVDNTVGVPLPGMRIRFGAQGELQIAGPYVARYLDETAEAGALPSIDPDGEHWIATGDLFVEHPDGYLEIVDRIKDIYKNNRGQTIAPQRVEQRLASVPGIRRGFLAGDHRDYNVLLIVLDRSDPVIAGRKEDDVHEYLAQIVASVNAGLAPYERVVRFAVLDRDFDLSRGELTAKGTFRRKAIEEHYAGLIASLYRSRHVDLDVAGVRVRIPRWFFRDLAVLEDDIVASRTGLHNRRTGADLRIARSRDGLVRVGDLKYSLGGEDAVDLGLFARQPRLWIGNPSLVTFSPCKTGWDLPLRGVSGRVRLPRTPPGLPSTVPVRLADDDGRLREVHHLCATALFGSASDAADAVAQLGERLARADARIASVIRRRLEALAYRPEEGIRAMAYRVLLLDEPLLDYDKAFPAFIDSGLTFLDEESITIIAGARHGERRLQALRQRLHSYRTRLTWPAPPPRRTQFQRLFRLLSDFARHHSDFFPAVQAELACWALFIEDPALARAAESRLRALNRWYEDTLRARVATTPAAVPNERVVFEFGIPARERDSVRAILAEPTFLRRSLAHAFGEEHFDWARVPPAGLWVSPVLSHHPTRLYRLGINLVDGKHFDLLLVTGRDMRTNAVRDTVLWLSALSGHAFATPVLPRFGAWRKDLGAASVAYISDLTAWERIRELASQHDVRDGIARTWAWRKLFVRAMSAFFRAWDQSGRRIVAGAVTPANVALPDADFHETASLLSLAGWRAYDGPLALVQRLARGFYQLTEAHYPQSRAALQLSWMFDACHEALGDETARAFLHALADALAAAPAAPDTAALQRALDVHQASLRDRPHVPLPVLCAIERFRDWERSAPAASPDAREEAVIQMIHLYRLERFPDAFRYLVYQRTYFHHATHGVHQGFDRFIARRLGASGPRHDFLKELSELQGLIASERDREVFGRMVFPHAHRTQRLEFSAVGPHDGRRVVVRSEITDESGGVYIVREPIGPAELGHFYRLLLETDYPKHIAAQDLHLVVTDREERVVGGLCYRWQEAGVVYVDGIVVARPLVNQGIGGGLVEDFCVRMAAQGARCVKTNFFLGRLFSKHGFQVNQRWGGLVRFLDPTIDGEAE
jgi:long-subunit acyl-CoA synthetase (AMP-forming)